MVIPYPLAKVRAEEIFKETKRAYGDEIGLKFGMVCVDRDHVHMVMLWGPGTSLSELMRLLKDRCAREMLCEFPKLRRERFWGGHM